MLGSLLIKDGTIVAITRIIGMGLGFAVTLILARTLGAADFGLYGYVVSLMLVLNVPLSNGWGSLVLRQIAAAQSPVDWGEAKGMILWGTFGSVILCAFVLICALGWAAVGGAPQSFPFWVLAVLTVVMLLDQLSALRLAALRGLKRPVMGQIPELLLRPMGILAGVTMLLAMGWPVTIEAVFLVLCCTALFSAVLGGVFLSKALPAEYNRAIPVRALGRWGLVAGLLASNSGLLILNAQTDILLLGAMHPMETVGPYRVAVQIALLSGFAYAVLNFLAAQKFTTLMRIMDTKTLAHTATQMARLAFVGALVVPVMMLIAGRGILESVFGTGFGAAYWPLMILCLGQLGSSFFGMGGSFLIAAKMERKLIWMTLGALICNICLCLILIPRFGALGAAISASCAAVSWSAVVWFFVFQHRRIDISALGISR